MSGRSIPENRGVYVVEDNGLMVDSAIVLINAIMVLEPGEFIYLEPRMIDTIISAMDEIDKRLDGAVGKETRGQ